jgi:PLD-like domain
VSFTLDAQSLIDDLAAIDGNAVQLATAVSLASRIEPELLRAVRLGMLVAADASAEADLWLSPLMSSRSALFAVMRPAVADVLRERLCAEPQRLDAAWQVLQRIHANAPAALRTEEEITWRVLANPDDPEIGRLFESVALAMEDGRSGLAKWAARALPRLPAQARQSGGAWRVAQKATEVLGGQPILSAELGHSTSVSVRSPFAIEKLPVVAVGLRLFYDALRISEPPEDGSETIGIPGTTPLVLELEWQQHDKDVKRTTLSFGPGSAQLVRPVSSNTLKITTAARDVYTIQLLAEEWRRQEFTSLAVGKGLAVRLYRGESAVLLSMDVAESDTDNLDGFAIVQQAPGQSPRQLLNLEAGQSFSAAELSSVKQPIRRFRWLDHLTENLTGRYMYGVTALHRNVPSLVQRGDEVQVSIDVMSPVGDVEIGFTRGLFQSPNQPPLKPEGRVLDFDTAPFAQRYELLGGSAYRLIMGFITACVQDPGSTLDVLAFDFDHPDILKAFESLGARLRIVLDDSPVHKNRQYELEYRLKQAGCTVMRGHFRRFSHSKAIIQKIDGEPTAVLTGSTNFSINSLFAQHNHVVVIRDKQTASIYENYFEEATSKSSKRHSWTSIERVGLPSMRVLICPSSELLPTVLDAVSRAQRSVLFSLGDAAQRLLKAVTEVSQRDMTPPVGGKTWEPHGLLVGGVVHSSSGQRVFWSDGERLVRADSQRRKLTSTTTGATSGNGKFVVVDFDQPEAVVYAGSSTFAQGATDVNGDDVLEIRDPSITTQFAIEALEMVDHYRFRALAAKSAGTSETEPSGDWWKPYYRREDGRFWERTLLANVTWPEEAPVAKKFAQAASSTSRSSSKPTERRATKHGVKRKLKKK